MMVTTWRSLSGIEDFFIQRSSHISHVVHKNGWTKFKIWSLKSQMEWFECGSLLKAQFSSYISHWLNKPSSITTLHPSRKMRGARKASPHWSGDRTWIPTGALGFWPSAHTWQLLQQVLTVICYFRQKRGRECCWNFSAKACDFPFRVVTIVYAIYYHAWWRIAVGLISRHSTIDAGIEAAFEPSAQCKTTWLYMAYQPIYHKAVMKFVGGEWYSIHGKMTLSWAKYGVW